MMYKQKEMAVIRIGESVAVKHSDTEFIVTFECKIPMHIKRMYNMRVTQGSLYRLSTSDIETSVKEIVRLSKEYYKL